MIVVKKEVYYCDHCKKRSLSKGHMNTHERHCTANPDRECRMCSKDTHFNIREIVEQLKTRFVLEETLREEYEDGPMITVLKAKWTGEPITLNEVSTLVSDCPNCMLAIIRQTKLAYHYFEGMGFDSFNYKQAVKDMAPNYSYEYDNYRY